MDMPERPTSGIVPFLTILDRRAVEALAFYATVFEAVEVERNTAPDGRLMQASLKINGGWVMLSDDFPEYRGSPASAPAGTIVHLPVDDVDRWWERALAAGAEPVVPIADQFWGDRYGQFRDPFGHLWSVSTPLRR